MPTLRIPIDLTWSGASGSPGVNVWHGRIINGGLDQTDLGDLTDMLQDFYTTLADVFPEGTTIRWAGEAQGVGDDSGDTFNSDPWTVDGGGTGGFLAPANALLIQWRTNTGGRSGRGRTFLSPLVLFANEDNGTPEESIRTLVSGAADDLISASSGFDNGALGVYSRTEDVFRDFVTAAVPNYFAVLRSRRD